MPTQARPIRVEFSLTVNLGDFNSVKLGCVLEDVLETGEVFEDKFDYLYNRISTKVKKELVILTHKVKAITHEENNNG